MGYRLIELDHYGSLSSLKLKEVKSHKPEPRHVLIRNTHIGVNKDDLSLIMGYRKEYYEQLPIVPGVEGVGVVEQVGDGAFSFKVGDRVAYISPHGYGSYRDQISLPYDAVYKLPKDISNEIAAASIYKFFKASFLIRHIFVAGPGKAVLINRVDDGIGALIALMGRLMGAVVIGGLADNSAKNQEAAKQNGCHFTVDLNDSKWPDEVRHFTKGYGVTAAYSGLNFLTLAKSLNCLIPSGILIITGEENEALDESSFGKIISPNVLYEKSIIVTYPNLSHYSKNKKYNALLFNNYITAIQSGEAKFDVSQSYAFENISLALNELRTSSDHRSIILTTGSE